MSDIQLRRVIQEDSETLFKWRNAPETRQFSFNHDIIAWDAHVTWFQTSLQMNNRFLLIGEIGSNPIGVLRYDLITPEEAKMAIYLMPGSYGKGIGTKLILEGIEWARNNLRVKSVKAEILSGNIASLKAFSKAGFQESYQVYQYFLK